MRRITKLLAVAAVILSGMMVSGEAISEPVMQNLQEQSECNKQGFYYDHSKEACTKTKILACSDETLRNLIAAQASNAEKWRKLHEDITRKGYQVSQCVKAKDHELVVNYVKRGLWPEFKTVRVLTH